MMMMVVVMKAYRGVFLLIKPPDKTDCPWPGSLNCAAVDCQMMANCFKHRIRLCRGDVMLFKGKYHIWHHVD